MLSNQTSTANEDPAIHGDGRDAPSSLRLAVTELPQRLRKSSPSTEPQQPQKPDPATEWRNPTLSTIEGLIKLAGYALSARALLLLALIGAFTLAVLAMATETLIRVYILISYCVLVVLPIVGLEIRKR